MWLVANHSHAAAAGQAGSATCTSEVRVRMHSYDHHSEDCRSVANGHALAVNAHL